MKKFNEKYDAYYDDKKDIWLEETCDNPKCDYCKNRPNKPSECKIPKKHRKCDDKYFDKLNG